MRRSRGTFWLRSSRIAISRFSGVTITHADLQLQWTLGRKKKKGFAHLYRLYWAALRCAIPTCFCTPVSPPVQPIQPITHSKSPNATHMMPYPMLFAPPPQAWTPAPRRQNPRDPIYPRRLNQQPGKDGLSFAREGLMRSPPKRPIHYMLLYDP